MTAPAPASASATSSGGTAAGIATFATQKTFQIVTTAQVERTYKVQANDEDQARARLRTHLADPDMLRDGVVVEQTAKQIDATPQRIKAPNTEEAKP